jgi:hypothetical protein
MSGWNYWEDFCEFNSTELDNRHEPSQPHGARTGDHDNGYHRRSFVAGMPAQAQQTEMEALRAQIEELTGRLQRLEESQATATATTKATPPITARAP